MAPIVTEPTSHTYESQRLKLHYVDWGNREKPLAVLVHGGRDHCRNWDWVAEALRHDYHVVAPDLRGHGDSQWSIGGSYAVIDFTLDLAELLDSLDPFPAILIGHSLGGGVVLQYAGTFPENVKKVVAIEGLGPPPHMIEDRPAHERMRRWITEMRELTHRRPRRYPSLDEAVARMREANPHLSEEQSRHLTIHGSYRDEDGSYLWKFDNYVRAMSPYMFNVDDARELWSRITCPVLLVRGADSWAEDPEKDGRASAFRDYQAVTVDGAGHWVHHDRLDVFLELVKRFLSERET